MTRILDRSLLFVACLFALSNSPLSGDDSQKLAEVILREAGIKGGLVVHLGCGDGKLTAALHAGDGYLVHGLDADAANVNAARSHVRSLGLCGKVSVDRLVGKRLPYIDNLVNLAVIQDARFEIRDEEIMRVLAPGGVAILLQPSAVSLQTLKKPWPEGIDEWTHYLHDASGNAVAKDAVVGPPKHYQWLAGPRWSSHHDTVLSTSAVVSAGGRMFCIVNEAPISEFHERSSGNWFLLARGAFNGVLLWKIPIAQWGWQAWGESFAKRFAQPVQLPSRLVTDGDRVYVTLGFHAPVSAVDAETGNVLKTYEATRSAGEILLHDGKLIVSVYDSKKNGAEKTIKLIDCDTGVTIWESSPHVGLPARYDAVEGWDPVYLTAYEDRVVFVSKGNLVCLEAQSGKTRWQIPRPAYHEHKMHLGVRQSENCTLVNDQDVVLYAQPAGQLPHTNHTVPCDLYAFAADTGKMLWNGKCGTWAWGHQADVFVIHDQVWVHEHIPTEMKGPAPVHLDSLNHALLGLDLRTGEVTRKIPTHDIFRIGHHHRCYRNKATTRFLFTARRGTETTELESGDIRLHPWVRSECRFGLMPANGLLYTFPHPCACYAGVKLTGFNALAAEGQRSEVRSQRSEVRGQRPARLEKGPAFGAVSGQQSAVRNGESGSSGAADNLISDRRPLTSDDDWPTYRHDIARSGFTEQHVSSNLKPAWQTELDGRLSSVVVAEGRLLVASIDTHTVHALHADSGEVLWSFAAGGRVDSPPTICDSHAVFGSADGYVYCLRAADGALVWRFRAAPVDQRMIVDNQPESVWPVHGSVLVQNGEVVVAAGRSSYLDGGLYAYRLDLKTGKIVEQKRTSHEQLTKRKALASEAERYDHYYTDGMLNDILVARGNSFYLKAKAVFGDERQNGPMLVSHSGFLDGSLFERSFWYLVAPGQQPIGAQLIVHDDQAVFGFRAYPSANRGGPWHVLGSGYTLFAASRSASKPPPNAQPTAQHYVPDFLSKPLRAFTWRATIPVRARAMVLTENALLVAGSPDVVRPDVDPYAAIEGKMGGKLLVISRDDGKTLAEHTLDAPPVWDGIAVSRGNVYFALQDGTVARMNSEK